MDIEVVWGTGEGQTSLSAFDAALAAAGIHNYNLVTLSSVIPPDATVVSTGTHDRRWEVGEMMGVVLARTESTVAGETVAAGLGWATATEGGVFFEATAESADTVETLLTRGVRTAQAEREDWHWSGDIETQTAQHTVERSGATVVSAVYRPV